MYKETGFLSCLSRFPLRVLAHFPTVYFGAVLVIAKSWSCLQNAATVSIPGTIYILGPCPSRGALVSGVGILLQDLRWSELIMDILLNQIWLWLTSDIHFGFYDDVLVTVATDILQQSPTNPPQPPIPKSKAKIAVKGIWKCFSITMATIVKVTRPK